MLLRAAILLAASAVTALVALLRTITPTGTEGARQVFTVLGGAVLAAVVVMTVCHLWDRWRGYLLSAEPVTVETVREAVVRSDKALHRVRAEDDRVGRLAGAIEQRLAQAHSETDFVALCNLHHESVGCADGAYGHYRSAGLSVQSMSRILAARGGQGR